jgi:hypothetical protein
MHLITKVHVPYAPPQPRMCDPTSPFQRFDVSWVPAWSRSRASLASGAGMTMYHTWTPAEAISATAIREQIGGANL